MKNTNTVLTLLIILLLFLVGYNTFVTTSMQEDFDKYRVENKKLQNKLDSISNINISLDKKIDTLYYQIGTIDNDISKIQTNVLTIKKKAYEKINNVDSYSTIQLEQFFADRYRHYFDTVIQTDSTTSY